MESVRHVRAKALQYEYRLMKAYVRYYLKYTPEVLKTMSIQDLVDAYNDVLYVRSRRSRFEPEE
jgi:hypothetical protein